MTVHAEGCMKARDMIAGAAFGPESVKDLQAAFAQAWEAIGDSFPENEHEAIRVNLARILLALRSEERLSVDGLRGAALKVMRARYGANLAAPRAPSLQRSGQDAPRRR